MCRQLSLLAAVTVARGSPVQEEPREAAFWSWWLSRPGGRRRGDDARVAGGLVLSHGGEEGLPLAAGLRDLGGLLVVCDLLVVDFLPAAPVLVLSTVERLGDVDRDGQVRVIRLGGMPDLAGQVG